MGTHRCAGDAGTSDPVSDEFGRVPRGRSDAADANGVPFSGAYVVATANLGSDMLANVHAEAGAQDALTP